MFTAHDGNRLVPGYGVRIGQNGMTAPFVPDNLTSVYEFQVWAWYSEVQHFTFGQGSEHTIGHFIQVSTVWKEKKISPHLHH